MPNGGALLAQALRSAQVETVFALHGGHLDAFFHGCLNQGIELVDFRHESSAGHAADAYARVTGRIGVCAVTSGPGFTNAISAIVSAQLDGIPMLVIVGAPPLREVLTNELQGGFDQIAMAVPGAKWAHRITNTERIPDLTAMAIRKATTGRKGVVVLEVPIDVMHLPVPPGLETPFADAANRPQPFAAPHEIEAAIALLRAAERPAIVCGVEAAQARCGEHLAAFAQAAQIPVFMTARGMGVLPAGHPLNGHQAGNIALLGEHKPDAVLLLGQRLGLRMGGRGDGLLARGARLIQVHADAGEIGRIRPIDLAISADCDAVCQQLATAAASQAWPDRSEWVRRATDAQWTLDAKYPDGQAAQGIHPYHGTKAVIEAVGPEGIFVLDGGESNSWAAHHVRVNHPGHLIGQGYLGCLGTGPGHAIGAQIAAPGRRVVQITGDGAMGFHIGEFDIMARRGLPIVTVILNNQVWGMSLHGQQILYGDDYHAISRLGGTHYANIAAAFGCHAERVTHIDEVAPAMARALASGKPACIELMTDPDVAHPVTAAALGEVPEGSHDVMIPYYENIPQFSAVALAD
jgi:acetolactate synthase-1/2/3 large subunit